MKKYILAAILLFFSLTLSACDSRPELPKAMTTSTESKVSVSLPVESETPESSSSGESMVSSSSSSGQSDKPISSSQSTVFAETSSEQEADKSMDIKLNITVGDKSFMATLTDSATTQAFIKKLPITIDMGDMNSNEKYYFFDDTFPSNSARVEEIKNGDIMLYGNNCLVLFYKGFSSSYSYTRLGTIDDTAGFSDAVGSGNVTVGLSME